MGERCSSDLRVRFDARLRLEFHGAKVTSDAGLLAFRELDAALGLSHLAQSLLAETRTGRNIQHELVALLRQSVYSRLAGYEDTNDAGRLAQDPAMRVIVSRRASEKQAASTNCVSRFETEMLTHPANMQALSRLNEGWVSRAMGRTKTRRLILDLDSSESPVHGEQEEASYNGHFACVCYHPLFCFNQYGDCEGTMLRPGHVHSAHDWKTLLEPVVARYRDSGLRKYLRADAAFARLEVYQYLEDESFLYAIRLPANAVLHREIDHLLTRPVGRPPKKPIIYYHDFLYQASSWERPRRVVAKVEWHQGELFPRVGFLVTNLGAKPQRVVRFYNGRGTAEGWIKEGKYALNWTRLSCHRFQANQVRLALFVLAYNLGNFLRRLVLPRSVRHWSLRTLQAKLIKIGAKVVTHSRRLIFQMVEVAVPRMLFEAILKRIGELAPAAA
ncbi:MAG TPA: IS1380 family transposase [Dehalococcoidia bacterium]|nr:IS1380 family transposase [Dehalococcoidia bacterium]